MQDWTEAIGLEYGAYFFFSRNQSAITILKDNT